jgi:hypothetical protein
MPFPCYLTPNNVNLAKLVSVWNFHEALTFFFWVEWGSWDDLWSYENRDVANYLVLVKKVMRNLS